MVDYREDAKWTVYIHIVPKELSGYDHDKYYVGITSQTVEKRWRNGNGYKTQIFKRVIEKYGWNNISHEIIAEHLTKDEACKLEQDLIRKLKSNTKKYGYNIHAGGDNKTFSLNDSDVSLKKELDNRPNILLGNHPRATPVICLNTLEIFDCMVSAGITYGISHHHIGSCCHGKIKSIGRHPITGEPLLWEFYDKNKEYSIQKYDNNSRGRKVVCLSTNELFLKVRDAEKKYNITHRNIDRNCNGARNLRGGAGKLNDGTLLQWQYYDDYLKQNNLTDEEARKRLFFVA